MNSVIQHLGTMGRQLGVFSAGMLVQSAGLMRLFVAAVPAETLLRRVFHGFRLFRQVLGALVSAREFEYNKWSPASLPLRLRAKNATGRSDLLCRAQMEPVRSQNKELGCA
ncbi:MAG: hypothetical protein ACYTEL_22010 [Planctomycetota bacterium]|jgi:hypothetical protein